MAETTPGFGRVVGLLALFLVLGAPMAAYIWHVVSDLLAGRVHGRSLLAALVLLGVFLLLLKALVRILPPSAKSET